MNVLEILNKAFDEEGGRAKAKAELTEAFEAFAEAASDVVREFLSELKECKSLPREIRDELRARRQ